MVDLGVVVRGDAGSVAGLAELRCFLNDVDDLIRYRPTAQHTAKAENIASARVLGCEAGGRARVTRHVSVIGALTWLDTEGPFGAELNWRPRLETQLRAELMSGRLGAHVDDVTLFASWTHRAAFFHDPANLVTVPERHWLGVGVRVDLPVGFSFLVTARDLLDQRGQDYLGFPMPGRRLAATVHYERDL